MPFRRKLIHFLHNLFYGRRLDWDLNAELTAYMDELTARKMDEGLAPEKAREAAIQEVGSIDSIMEQVRYDRGRFNLRTAGLTCATILLCTLTVSAQSNIFFNWIDRWFIEPFSPEPEHIGSLTSNPDPRAPGYYIVSATALGS